MTNDELRTEVLTFFKTNYDLITPSAPLGLSPLPELVYDNKSQANEDTNLAWLRVTLKPVLGVQETLGQSGTRRFKRQGLLFIQIFTPLDKGMQASDHLADGIINFLEGGKTPTNNIPFNNVSPPQNMGNEGSWQQVNIDAEFIYHTLK
jgi:hypothetical protein